MKAFYEHVAAAAGFSGENWDISQGHNVSYTTTAGDLAFDSATKTLTLTAGTWPAWMVVGKQFTTDSATNPGPFTVAAIDGTNKILTVVEAVADETPAGTTVVDGSGDTHIQDVLLSAGNGVLTEDAPHVLVSTGTLGAARTLDISALEVETSAHGSQPLDGRFFYLSIQNTDISSTNKITMSAGTTINGAATFDITSEGDYLFHHVEGGVWRVNTLARPAEPVALLKRVPFTAADWNADPANPNRIKVIRVGTPAAGEVGPHAMAEYDSYVVQVINDDLSPNEIVDAEVQIDTNGDIIIHKAKLKNAFNGIALIIGSLD